MSELKKEFEQALLDVKTLTKKPSDDELLELYSFYKQATDGDVTGERPGFFDFAGAAKFDAREALKGMSKDDAMKKYTETVKGLLG